MKYILIVVVGFTLLGSTSCNDSTKDQKAKNCLHCTGCFGEYDWCIDRFKPTVQCPTLEAFQDSIIAKNGTWTDWCEKVE